MEEELGKMVSGENMEVDNDDVLRDEITGRTRKPVMAVLNKKRVTSWEMDELFGGLED